MNLNAPGSGVRLLINAACSVSKLLRGVGVGGGHVPPPPPQKKKQIRKIFFGQLLCKIRAFSGNNRVKFGNLVNVLGKYNKN